MDMATNFQLLPSTLLALLTMALCAVHPALGQDYELVWADEFDGTEVDLTKWEFQTGDGCDINLCGWGNNEKQWYQAENATVADGVLTITAREEEASGYDYTSARLRTLGMGDWTYGRFEMRARMPVGQGLWPAFWMLPSDEAYGGWAASGEIDIMEYLGQDPDRVSGTIHYGGPWPNNVFSSEEYVLDSGTFAEDFHIFAIEWEAHEIRWYVDDVHYATQTSDTWYSTGGPSPAPFDQPFHLLLNMAVGGNLPGDPDETTEFPQELVVDYVRVYQVDNEAPTVSITSPADDATITPGTDLTISVDATDPDGMVERVTFYQGDAVLGADDEAPFEWTVADVAEGCYTLRTRATDAFGATDADTVTVTVGSCTQAPYLMTPAALPGTVEAENYDLGGQDVAYNDADPDVNSGNEFGNAYRRNEGVDLQNTSDGGADHNVGWIEEGEWLEYQVDVQESGTYRLDVRVASESDGGALRVEFDGVDATGEITFEATGGWEDWTTVRTEDVALDAGVQTMRVVMLSGGFNLNRITVSEEPTCGMEPVVFDDFEAGPAWTFFGGNDAGGGGEIADDRPREGDAYLRTGWGGQGTTSSFYGGFFQNRDDAEQLTLPCDPWINVFVYHESTGSTIDGYTLELTVREDTDGNGWTDGEEDSFRLDTEFTTDDFNDEWLLVSAPLSDFMDLETGGDGTFDGALDEVVVVIGQVSGPTPSDLQVDFDYLVFSSGEPISTAVEDPVETPAVYHLGAAYPNPFNPEAHFELSVAQTQHVVIELFDSLGRSVARLYDGMITGNTPHRFTLDGSHLASGVYTYRVTGESFRAARTVVLLK